MCDQTGGKEQERDVNGEDAELRELVVGMVCAVDGGHEMRIIEEEGQGVEGEGPTLGGRGRNIVGQEKQRSSPRAAADDEIEPRAVNPGSAGLGTVTRRHRARFAEIDSVVDISIERNPLCRWGWKSGLMDAE